MRQDQTLRLSWVEPLLSRLERSLDAAAPSTCRTRSGSAPWLILNGGLRYDGYEEFDRVTPRRP